MSTKQFASMSSKKLRNILLTASPEEQAEINAILNERSASTSTVLPEQNDNSSENMSEDDMKMLDELEKSQSQSTTENEGSATSKNPKMTLVECEALAKELSDKYVGHKCDVVPFNTLEWVPAIIRGIIVDKRSNKVMFAILTDDGRRIVKAHDSKMIKISAEVGSVTSRRRGSASSAEKLDEASLMKKVVECGPMVGRIVSFVPTKDIYFLDDLQKSPVLAETIPGVIVSIVPDKRSGRILYRIESELRVYDQNSVSLTRAERLVTHKVSTASDLVITDEYNDEIRAKYEKRQQAAEIRANMTPADILELSRKMLKKAEDNLVAAQEALEARKADLEAAEAAYEAFIANNAENVEENEHEADPLE